MEGDGIDEKSPLVCTCANGSGATRSLQEHSSTGQADSWLSLINPTITPTAANTNQPIRTNTKAHSLGKIAPRPCCLSVARPHAIDPLCRVVGIDHDLLINNDRFTPLLYGLISDVFFKVDYHDRG